jgi:hypothetical protein
MKKDKDSMPVIEMIEPAPACLNISRESWSKTPKAVRDDTLRMVEELNERVPIAKDIAAGRVRRHGLRSGPNAGKRVLGGHWELHACENDPTPANLARASELRGLLSEEIAHWAAVEARDADLADFHALAAAGGTTLKAALTAYVAAEQRLRLNPAAELARIAETVGFDIEVWARQVLAA